MLVKQNGTHNVDHEKLPPAQFSKGPLRRKRTGKNISGPGTKTNKF
jgi:hypothetical protein